MPLITGRYTPGNQAAMIRGAFQARSLEGLMLAGGVHPGVAKRAGGMGQAVTTTPPTAFSTTTTAPAGSGIASQIIGAVTNFVQSRWGQQRGTITYDPVTGQVIQKQSQGVPISTQAPLMVTGSGYLGGTSNPAIDMGTLALYGGGALIAVMMISALKKK